MGEHASAGRDFFPYDLSYATQKCLSNNKEKTPEGEWDNEHHCLIVMTGVEPLAGRGWAGACVCAWSTWDLMGNNRQVEFASADFACGGGREGRSGYQTRRKGGGKEEGPE